MIRFGDTWFMPQKPSQKERLTENDIHIFKIASERSVSNSGKVVSRINYVGYGLLEHLSRLSKRGNAGVTLAVVWTKV